MKNTPWMMIVTEGLLALTLILSAFSPFEIALSTRPRDDGAIQSNVRKRPFPRSGTNLRAAC